MMQDDSACDAHFATGKSAQGERALCARFRHPAVMDSQWFRNRMKQRGITQEALAGRFARDRTVISKMIAGDVPLLVRHLPVLVELLDVPLAEIMLRAGFPVAEPAPETLPVPAESEHPQGGMAEPPPNPVSGQPIGAPVIDRAGLRYAFDKVMTNFIDEADGTIELVDIDGLFDRVWRGYTALGERGGKILQEGLPPGADG